jgi:NADP-dependent 3-hydroxy acid dehydrogenase YdfG
MDSKQNFMPGIRDKVVVITGASSGIGEATQNFARGTRARVMALVRRCSRLPGMPDAFDRVPLR